MTGGPGNKNRFWQGVRAKMQNTFWQGVRAEPIPPPTRPTLPTYASPSNSLEGIRRWWRWLHYQCLFACCSSCWALQCYQKKCMIGDEKLDYDLPLCLQADLTTQSSPPPSDASWKICYVCIPCWKTKPTRVLNPPPPPHDSHITIRISYMALQLWLKWFFWDRKFPRYTLKVVMQISTGEGKVNKIVKNDIFLEALFVATTFPKRVKTSLCLLDVGHLFFFWSNRSTSLGGVFAFFQCRLKFISQVSSVNLPTF